MDASTHLLVATAPGTTAAAGFPFERFRRLRFARRSPPCVHCGASRVQRWGHFSSRQRYRCTACHRTFSDFTGTPLAHLKLLDRWPAFFECIQASLTVRSTGRLLGVDKDTAFRWRHRLLADLDASDTTTLHPSAVLIETWFAHSEKGSRSLDRPPRRRRALHRNQITPVWVLVARDPSGRLASGVVGLHRPTHDDLAALLLPHLHPHAELVSTIGYYGAPARMADNTGHAHRRVQHHDPEFRPVRDCVLGLHRWIRRFRGVATRYLDNYLAWHRLLTTHRLLPGHRSATRHRLPVRPRLPGGPDPPARGS